MPCRDIPAEYADATIYDLENSDFEPIGPFCLEMARRSGGPVLDLGCGTGRFTIPLARQGFETWGLDVAPAMLARAREKSGDLPIRWVEADACDFDLGARFGLVIDTGGMFEHLLAREEQERMLATVREHLAPDGSLVLATVLPGPQSMRDVAEEHWSSYRHDQGHEVRLSGSTEYDPVRQICIETAYRRWTDASGEEIVLVAPLPRRLVFPQEMESLLHYNGFEVVDRYGDYDFSPLTGDSRMVIHVCRSAA